MKKFAEPGAEPFLERQHDGYQPCSDLNTKPRSYILQTQYTRVKVLFWSLQNTKVISVHCVLHYLVNQLSV